MLETTPVEPEASSTPTTVLLPADLLPGPSSSCSILIFAKAGIQRIAQAVITILKKPEAAPSSLLAAGSLSSVVSPIGKSFLSIIAFFLQLITLQTFVS